MSDCYQQAVEYLTANPDLIPETWRRFYDLRGGCLFCYANFGGMAELFGDVQCGCLTMIRSQRTNACNAATVELTEAIRGDDRIPTDPERITVDLLPVFAGWQRRIDQALGRTPPPLDPRLPTPTGDIEIPEPEAARQLA